MNKLTASLALGALTIVAPLVARAASPDKEFMTKAAQGGQGEVTLGRLATQRGSSPAVKEFGQRMVTDHSKANRQLMQVAAKEHVRLPKTMPAEDKPLQAKLSKLSGAAFDRAYASAMVEDHTKDIAEFSKEAQNGKDPAARAFAAKTLPTLKMHLQMAKRMASQTHAK